MPAKSVIKCAQLLAEKGLTVSFAESASTGKFVYDFTSVPDCGTAIRGSIVCYDRSVKEELFGIPAAIIDEHSAESPEVTQLLADCLKKLIPADVIIAVTGLASPGGSESDEKPVGTMFVHGYIRERPFAEKFFFVGTPDEIIGQTIDAVASLLVERLS